MAIIEEILNDEDFDVVDTPKEGTEQRKKQEELKSINTRAS